MLNSLNKDILLIKPKDLGFYGQIYLITNNINNKKYIGQYRTLKEASVDTGLSTFYICQILHRKFKYKVINIKYHFEFLELINEK